MGGCLAGTRPWVGVEGVGQGSRFVFGSGIVTERAHTAALPESVSSDKMVRNWETSLAANASRRDWGMDSAVVEAALVSMTERGRWDTGEQWFCSGDENRFDCLTAEFWAFFVGVCSVTPSKWIQSGPG